MSNDDRRDWDPYGTERGDGGQPQGRQPGQGSYGPDGQYVGEYTGYPPPAAPGGAGGPGGPGGPGGLDPVSFTSQEYPPQEYRYDPSGYDPNAYAPGPYEATGHAGGAGGTVGGYDPNAYGAGGAPAAGGYDATGYDATTYDPAAYQGPPGEQQGGYPPAQGYYEQQVPRQPTGYYDGPPAADLGGYRTEAGQAPVVPPSRGASVPIPAAGVNPAGIGSAVPPARPAPEPERRTPTPPPADDGRVPQPRTRRPAGARTGKSGKSGKPGYGSDEFAFVDDESEQAEDVIDWLSFAETRSERRDERRRSIRQRLVALGVVIAVALLGVGGYVAWDTWLRDEKSAAAPGQRGAVLVQLRDKDGRASSNAVLTVDPGKNTASMVSVSSVTTVNSDNTATSLGQLMADAGPGASRDALSDLLGVKVDGSWVVTEPVLQGLVDLAGGIQLNADVEVKAPDGKVLVTPGRNPANGAAALAFANFRLPGEAPAIGADRFGRVLQGLLAAFPTKSEGILPLLANMANLPDPSLPDDKLGTLLASLAKATQAKQIQVRALPVSPDGVLDAQTAVPIVRELLGGTVRQGRVQNGPARVMVDDASGKPGAQEDAHTRLLNAGNTYVPGGVQGKRTQPTSTVQYVDDARKDAAVQVALSLHLPPTAVKKAEGEMLADVVVTLGQDYVFEPPKSQ